MARRNDLYHSQKTVATTMTKSKETFASRSKPTRERVYRYVREQILRGRFAGGSFVEEEMISSALGVSRTPVREAFHRLEAERFIDLFPRRGALVRQVTAQELVDVSEARCMIEGHAISRICRKRIRLPGDADTILHKLERIPRSDYFNRVELNCQFHFVIIAAVGNAMLSELYQTLGARQRNVAMTAINSDSTRFVQTRREHQALIAALAEWDEAGALTILQQHLRPIMRVQPTLDHMFA